MDVVSAGYGRQAMESGGQPARAGSETQVPHCPTLRGEGPPLLLSFCGALGGISEGVVALCFWELFVGGSVC